DGACERTALLFVDASSPVAPEALASTAAAALLHERCCVVVIDLSANPDAAARALAETGASLPIAVAAQRLPAPLDAIAATPTTVVIDSAGRIEAALVGVRPQQDLEKLFRGDAAITSEP
ncbi:MAG: TlpA family protein disulfide reductase, partial [Phycisphaerales bacterium]